MYLNERIDRDDMKRTIAKAFQVPMSMIDARPWVSTEAESDPSSNYEEDTP